MIEPGATIGVLGGGQLGRMLCIAAAQLGYRCHIYAPEEAPPAADVSAAVTQGDYGDGDALRRFAAPVDVVKIGRAQSELQSLMRISYAVFCLKKKKIKLT